jgi:hypothetical protein
MWERLRQRYETENQAGRELFRFAVKEAMILSIFGVAAHFDGASGYDPIGDRVGEFAVALNVYRSLEDTTPQGLEETVQICPTRRGEDVHDIFMNLVDEWETSQGRNQ